MIYKITFMTSEGEGEAVRTVGEGPFGGTSTLWDVSTPLGDFRWHGCGAEVKREIRRRMAPDKIESFTVLRN